MTKVDRNMMVDDLMKEVPRTGFKYLDLETGLLLKDIGGKKKEEKQDEGLDLNNDGKFDEKDKKIAGKVLATKIKK